MESTTTAAVYLCAVLGIAIMLVFVYICIVKGCCWCFASANENRTTNDDYTALASDDEDNTVIDVDEFGSDMVSNSCLQGTTMSDDDLYKSAPNLGGYLSSAKLSRDLAVSDPGIAVSAYGDQREKKTKFQFRKKKKKKKEDFSTEALMSVTVKHSSSDLYLLISIHGITGLSEKVTASLSHVYVSVVFLPDKRYATKTKLNTIKRSRIDQSFKFAAVKREDLFQSAVRFRVYGRNVKLGVRFGGEKFLGEMTLQLADVAQSGGCVTVERNLLPKVAISAAK